ncbi:MAG: phenylalanine--tRNA ligase beta subunit-related protein [Patescibacteria group bacterium]
MIVPVEWLKQYVNTNKSAKELATSFTALGLMLDRPIATVDGQEVLDLEHRMDRSDWLGILGCARDLAAFENTQLLYPQLNTGTPKALPDNEKIKIEVKDCTTDVHRFYTRIFKNITVKESPNWLKTRLAGYGMPSKNNIVDITNYVMIELGQPMHAQDINKMRSKEIVFRYAKPGESIVTLLGENVKLDPQTFVLTQSDVPTCIGGIVGGKETGVDSTTTQIVLDSGTYNQVSIRKSSRRLKIQNETVLRYDKFLHPQANKIAIERATQLILELAGGECYENYDYYPTPWELKEKTITLARTEKIAGFKVEMESIKRILNAIGYETVDETAEKLTVKVPYFRTDVEVEDDLVADVLRLQNYANIPLKPIHGAPPKEVTPKVFFMEETLRNELVAQGLHEHITEPLVEMDASNNSQIVLQNALTSEKSALRTSIEETLKTVLETYKKHNVHNINIFEIGKEYLMLEQGSGLDKFREDRVLQVLVPPKSTAQQTSAETRKVLYTLFKDLGINSLEVVKNTAAYDIKVEGERVGELKTYGFKLYTESLLNKAQTLDRVRYKVATVTSQDLAIQFEQIPESLGTVILALNNLDNIKSVFVLEDEIYENTILFKIEITSTEEESLTTEKITQVRNTVLTTLASYGGRLKTE